MASEFSFRPIGDNVMVMFPQDEWERNREGFMETTKWFGEGYRLDGIVSGVGNRVPDEIRVGMTVYGDPKAGRVVNIEGTRYHLMKYRDLYMRSCSRLSDSNQ